MDITGEYRIEADRQAVWAALNDPDMLLKCIPGCESLEKLSETELQALIRAVIGPVKARFNTDITLDDINPPESYTINGSAKAGPAGFARGSARVRLEEDGDATHLHYSAHFSVGGKLAQVGSRLVLGVTRKTADEFFGAVCGNIDSGAVRLHAAPEGLLSNRTKVWMALSVAALLLLLGWFLLS